LEQKSDLELSKEGIDDKKTVKEIITEGVTPIHDMGGGYVEYKNSLYQKEALRELRPDLFSAKADTIGIKSNSNFGTQFPRISKKGDVFVRVDVMPNKVFKFDGQKWIEINKGHTDTYLYDAEYIRYLVEQIDKGNYDVDLLSESEEEQIRNYLNNDQNT
jgi:hypothetical protein